MTIDHGSVLCSIWKSNLSHIEMDKRNQVRIACLHYQIMIKFYESSLAFFSHDIYTLCFYRIRFMSRDKCLAMVILCMNIYILWLSFVCLFPMKLWYMKIYRDEAEHCSQLIHPSFFLELHKVSLLSLSLPLMKDTDTCL